MAFTLKGTFSFQSGEVTREHFLSNSMEIENVGFETLHTSTGGATLDLGLPYFFVPLEDVNFHNLITEISHLSIQRYEKIQFWPDTAWAWQC